MEEIKFVEKPGVRTNLFELYEVIGNSVNLLPPPLEARNLFDQIINGIQDAQGGFQWNTMSSLNLSLIP